MSEPEEVKKPKHKKKVEGDPYDVKAVRRRLANDTHKPAPAPATSNGSGNPGKKPKPPGKKKGGKDKDI